MSCLALSQGQVMTVNNGISNYFNDLERESGLRIPKVGIAVVMGGKIPV